MWYRQWWLVARTVTSQEAKQPVAVALQASALAQLKPSAQSAISRIKPSNDSIDSPILVSITNSLQKTLFLQTTRRFIFFFSTPISNCVYVFGLSLVIGSSVSAVIRALSHESDVFVCERPKSRII